MSTSPLTPRSLEIYQLDKSLGCINDTIEREVPSSDSNTMDQLFCALKSFHATVNERRIVALKERLIDKTLLLAQAYAKEGKTPEDLAKALYPDDLEKQQLMIESFDLIAKTPADTLQKVQKIFLDQR
jgi:hypothetical protein